MIKLERGWLLYGLLLGIFNIFCTMASTTSMNESGMNLTSVLWAHAVNSKKLLAEALASKIDMIEADIILGHLENDTNGNQLPVMGHPPDDKSDISLETFLNTILDYNTKNPNEQKGVKLDFKSTVVYLGSIDMLTKMWTKMKYPIWLNADIIAGPVNPVTVPVDPNNFFTASKNFPSAVLSIGWTTQWGSNFTEGEYTKQQVDAMINSIKKNNITMTKHEITFPVRAGIAANSLTQLRSLFAALDSTNKLTLTVWSSAGDNVNVDKLRELIFDFGVDKVYLDVPVELSSKLNLGRGNSCGSNLPSLINFGFISLSMFLISKIFQS